MRVCPFVLSDRCDSALLQFGIMISGTLLVLAFATILLCYFINRKLKWKNSPPGPRGLPFVGNMFQLEKHQHISFSKWAKEYGPLYKINVANLKMVVVSDHKMLKEMFLESAFSGRMDFHKFDFIPDGKVHGIVNTEGEQWEEIRHFTLRQLRDFGFGKNSMEESIMTEVNELVEGIAKVSKDGKPIENVKQRLTLAVVNSLWMICTGKRNKQDDPEVIRRMEAVNDSFNSMLEDTGFALFVPWLLDMFPNWTGYTKILKQIAVLADYFREPIDEHEKTFSEDFDRDFLDVFLRKMKQTTDSKSAFYGTFGRENLLATLGDLYFAGSDTTSSTLSWLTLYLSKYPEMQRKFQKEMESITGNTRQCTLADRPNMPFTEALFAETLRFSSITPGGVPHRAIKDQEFKGYMIPKDTVIQPNVHYIHHDPKIWGDPENFRPERFLSPDGKTFKKNDALIPFSVGRRQCLGESLARDSLFLFSTCIFQRFSVEFDKSGPDHGLEPEIGFLLNPKPFRVFYKDRQL